MGKKTIKYWLREGSIAVIVLAIPFALLFLGTFVVPALLSIWATLFVLIRNWRKQNPAINEKNWFKELERFFYFHVVNMAFAFALLVELMTLLTIGITIALAIVLLKQRKNASAKTIKWTKYIVLHLFNLGVLLLLIGTFADVELQILIFVLPIITFLNGIQAAFFIQLEQNLKPGLHKAIATIIILVMVASTAWQMFPS